MMKNMLIADNCDSDSSSKEYHPRLIAGITWDYLKFVQFHDADDFFAGDLIQRSSNIEHAEPDGSHLSSEIELGID